MSLVERLCEAKAVSRGLLSYLPAEVEQLTLRTDPIDYARYSYSVWFRHMTVLYAFGLRQYPRAIAELGPGPSLGVGLTALISGTENYYALDVSGGVDTDKEVAVFDSIVEMVKTRQPIPAFKEFPRLQPQLERYDFPDFLFEPGRLEAMLDRSRLLTLRKALVNPDSESIIRYVAPWEQSTVSNSSLDLVLSQAVMERVDDLPLVYGTIASWLRPGGYTSHSIDFAEPRTSLHWNGNWAHPDWLWALMRGRRSSWGSRLPHSTHAKVIQAEGLQLVADDVVNDDSGLPRQRLARRYRDLCDADLAIRAAFLVAVKPQ